MNPIRSRLTLLMLIACAFAATSTGARAREASTASLAAASDPARGKKRPAAPQVQSEKRDERTRDTAAGDAQRGRPRVAPRILDATRIEGEIPVPQVLFITARDQRRFMEFQHHRYQVTSAELGRATPVPSRLVVSTPSPDKARQEDPR